MSSAQQPPADLKVSTRKKKSRLHLHHHLRQHIHHKSLPQTAVKKTVTKQDRQLIEQYVLSKLQSYSNKPRLWQIAHSSHIRKRLLDRSQDIAELHSLPAGSVHEIITELFQNVDKHVSTIRQLLQSTSKRSIDVFEKLKSTNNRWRLLQIERAKQTLPDLNNQEEQLTDDELLQKYSKYICETLTPKPDPNSSNCIAQLREQPFDLDNGYAKAARRAKKHLAKILGKHDQTPIPDLNLIGEMVDFGLDGMKTRPSNEEFENATHFLSKISVLHRSRQAYTYGLQNMGDDFMLLRFGKIFGPDAFPTTERTNNQFVYLVHLFLKSISQLVLLFQTNENDFDQLSSTILTLIGTQFSSQSNAKIIEYPADNEELFSPKANIDQWTWLFEKWLDALRTFPILLTNVGAFARLLRTTIGIAIARIYHFAEKIIQDNELVDMGIFNEQIFHALQMGFYFGIAYGIVDCVQDEIRNVDQSALQEMIPASFNEKNASPVEILDKWLLIMEDLLSGKEYNRNELPKMPLTPLLLETFDSLVTLSKSIDVTSSAFNELALLLRSQRVDKKTPEEVYSNEEIFLGAILKSHYTYTCTTYLGNIQSAREESERLWIMPFLGQLTDDCRDFYDDLTSNSVTSFTQYESVLRRSQTLENNLVNPFFVFLNLCIDLYRTSHYDAQTGAFLGRRIARTLKSIEISHGESALRQFLHIFCQDHPSLHDYLWHSLRGSFSNISDPEKSFFRVIQKESIAYARTNRKLETYVGDHLKQIQDALKIHSFRQATPSPTLPTHDRDEQLLISAMNYSVTAGGKRLRPLMMLMVADVYKINIKNVLPLACAIEYLHTSSLIFDDLPAQDNSDLRRGRPTLHKTAIDNDIPANLYEGRAQLAAVDLIAMSINVINNDLVKRGFSAELVNAVIAEISLSMHDLCIGQMMDLRAAHMGVEESSKQMEELDRIAWFKTGKAIEIVLITPAILHGEATETITRIRELSRLMGILFQMRDDLLDIEGENIGKPAALDVKNHTVTYVSVLGLDGTRQRLKEFRRETLSLVDQCWPVGAGTMKDVVNYIANRKN